MALLLFIIQVIVKTRPEAQWGRPRCSLRQHDEPGRLAAHCRPGRAAGPGPGQKKGRGRRPGPAKRHQLSHIHPSASCVTAPQLRPGMLQFQKGRRDGALGLARNVGTRGAAGSPRRRRAQGLGPGALLRLGAGSGAGRRLPAREVASRVARSVRLGAGPRAGSNGASHIAGPGSSVRGRCQCLRPHFGDARLLGPLPACQSRCARCCQ